MNKRDFLKILNILTPKTYIIKPYFNILCNFKKNQFAFAGVLLLRISRKRKPCSEYIPYFEKKGETKYCTVHNWVELFLKEAFIFSWSRHFNYISRIFFENVASWRYTAKRKLERLQFSTSSSFVKIWSACSCEFKAYLLTFWALYHLFFDLETIGVN